MIVTVFFFFSSRRRHTRCSRDWSSDVCSSDLGAHRLEHVAQVLVAPAEGELPGNALGLGERRRGGRRSGGPEGTDVTGRPPRVRPAARHFALRLRIVQDRLAAGGPHTPVAPAPGAPLPPPPPGAE